MYALLSFLFLFHISRCIPHQQLICLEFNSVSSINHFILFHSCDEKIGDDWDSLLLFWYNCLHICPIHRSVIASYWIPPNAVIAGRTHAQNEINDELMTRDSNTKRSVLHSLTRFFVYLLLLALILLAFANPRNVCVSRVCNKRMHTPIALLRC